MVNDRSLGSRLGAAEFPAFTARQVGSLSGPCALTPSCVCEVPAVCQEPGAGRVEKWTDRPTPWLGTSEM